MNLLGTFSNLEQACIFVRRRSSVGLDHVFLENYWRAFSGMIAANEMLLLSVNTAILVEAVRELLNANDQYLRNNNW